MQLTTAISEGVLAAATLVASGMLARSGRRWCAAWMLAIALAAIAGALRFSGIDHLESLHSALSRWAATVAFPSFCWAMTRYLYSGRDVPPGESLAIAAALNFVLLIAASADVVTAIGAVALLIALVGAYALYAIRRHACLMIGWAVALYATAGLWVGGSNSYLGPLLRVDVYHYLLAVANLLFAAALWPQAQSVWRRGTA